MLYRCWRRLFVYDYDMFWDAQRHLLSDGMLVQLQDSELTSKAHLLVFLLSGFQGFAHGLSLSSLVPLRSNGDRPG
jgi:hypothetical protein